MTHPVWTQCLDLFQGTSSLTDASRSERTQNGARRTLFLDSFLGGTEPVFNAAKLSSISCF